MNFYRYGYVYSITCNITQLKYIGSTNVSVQRRVKRHISDFKANKINLSTSKFILKNNDYKIDTLEILENQNLYQLRRKERFYIQNTECVNKFVPTLTHEENKEARLEYQRNYRKNNPEKMQEQDHKKYEKFKDKNIEKAKIYYDNNKEKIKEIRKQRIICECGLEIMRCIKYRHIKTQQHINNLSLLKGPQLIND